jgi:hypothetical protein
MSGGGVRRGFRDRGALVAQQHQFFGRGRVDRHRVAKIGEGDAALERHRITLQDLVGAVAEQVDAGHAPLGPDADQLEAAALGEVRELSMGRKSAR